MADKEKKFYLTYRPFYAANSLIVKPGAIVKCTELEAMCINTMQHMTLRKMKERDYGTVKRY